MGCFGSDVPKPTGLSTEEANLLQKTGMTLDQFAASLTEEQLQQKETQELLRNLSGLYRKVDRTRPGAPNYDSTRANRDFDLIKANASKLAAGNFSWGSGTVDDSLMKDVRNMAFAHKNMDRLDENEKVQLIVATANNLKNQIEDADNPNRVNMSKRYGFWSPTTETYQGDELDPDAVAALRARLETERTAQQQLQTQATEFLSKFLNRDKSEYEQLQEEAGVLSARRLVAALKGEIPLSKQFTDKKLSEFGQLKTFAGRQGIKITGDSPETAVADSTAGAAMLEAFNTRYDYAEQLERRGEIDAGTAQNLQRYGLMSDILGKQFAQATTLYGIGTGGNTAGLNLSNMALQAGAPNYQAMSSLAGGYMSMLSPYQNQSNLLYQGRLLDYQQQQAMWQALAQAGSSAATAAILA